MNKRAAFFRKKENCPEFYETVEFRECSRKQKYKSERVANKAVQEMQKYDKAPIRSYKCRYCKNWHLTSKEIKK